MIEFLITLFLINLYQISSRKRKFSTNFVTIISKNVTFLLLEDAPHTGNDIPNDNHTPLAVAHLKFILK